MNSRAAVSVRMEMTIDEALLIMQNRAGTFYSNTGKAMQVIRVYIAEALKPSHNKQSTPCSCGKEADYHFCHSCFEDARDDHGTC
jgi:hypothetical protein